MLVAHSFIKVYIYILLVIFCDPNIFDYCIYDHYRIGLTAKNVQAITISKMTYCHIEVLVVVLGSNFRIYIRLFFFFCLRARKRVLSKHFLTDFRPSDKPSLFVSSIML